MKKNCEIPKTTFLKVTDSGSIFASQYNGGRGSGEWPVKFKSVREALLARVFKKQAYCMQCDCEMSAVVRTQALTANIL